MNYLTLLYFERIKNIDSFLALEEYVEYSFIPEHQIIAAQLDISLLQKDIDATRKELVTYRELLQNIKIIVEENLAGASISSSAYIREWAKFLLTRSSHGPN